MSTFTQDQLKDVSHTSFACYVIKTNLQQITGVSLWLSPSVEDKFSVVPLSKHLSLIKDRHRAAKEAPDFGTLYADLHHLLVDSQPPSAWKLLALEATGAYNFQRAWDALVEPHLEVVDRAGRTVPSPHSNPSE